MLADQGEAVSDERHRHLLSRAAAGAAVATMQAPWAACCAATSPTRAAEDAA